LNAVTDPDLPETPHPDRKHTPDQDPPKDGASAGREPLDSRWGAAMRGIVKNAKERDRST